MQCTAPFRHRIGVQWKCSALVHAHTKLGAGKLSLRADPRAILTHFDPSSDDGEAGTLKGRRIRGRRNTGTDRFFCISLILMLGIPAENMQTSAFSKGLLFLGAKCSTLKRDQRRSRLIDKHIMAHLKRTCILRRWAHGSNGKLLVILSAHFHMCFIVSWAKAAAPSSHLLHSQWV